jgi:hypothetical protein
VRATSAKFGLRAGNVKFGTQNEEGMRMPAAWFCRRICLYVTCRCLYVTCHCLYVTCHKIALLVAREADETCSSQRRWGVVIFRKFLEWIRNAINACINQQLVSFENCFGVLSWLCQGRVKRRLLIMPTNVSASCWLRGPALQDPCPHVTVDLTKYATSVRRFSECTSKTEAWRPGRVCIYL